MCVCVGGGKGLWLPQGKAGASSVPQAPQQVQRSLAALMVIQCLSPQSQFHRTLGLLGAKQAPQTGLGNTWSEGIRGLLQTALTRAFNVPKSRVSRGSQKGTEQAAFPTDSTPDPCFCTAVWNSL